MFLQMTGFLFLFGWILFMCVCVCKCNFLHLFITEGLLSCSHVLTFVNNTESKVVWRYLFTILISFSLDKYPEKELLDHKVVYGHNTWNPSDLIWFWKLRMVCCPLSWVIIFLRGLTTKFIHLFSTSDVFNTIESSGYHRSSIKTIWLQPGLVYSSSLLWVPFLIENHSQCVVYEPRKYTQVWVEYATHKGWRGQPGNVVSSSWGERKDAMVYLLLRTQCAPPWPLEP